MKRYYGFVFALLFAVVSCENKKIRFIDLEMMNSHETYFTIHHINGAHSMATGKGVKVGIIDHGFALKKHDGFYQGSVDFINDEQSLTTIQDHGYWMAKTLKEVAPDVEIYAVNAVQYGKKDERQIEILCNVLDWAITNGIDLLSYSHERLPSSSQLNQKMKEAQENGVISNSK